MQKILIVEDDQATRYLIKRMLTKNFECQVIEASNGEIGFQLVKSELPDLIFLDISMPVMGGIEAATKALELYPDLKIITLSSFGNEQYYYAMIEAGVKGFVLKSSGITELIQAIEEVGNGGSWFSNELLRKVIVSIGKKDKNNVANLTERELEVLRAICKGQTNEQIANELNLSADTVKWHRSNIFAKTEVSNAPTLVIYAIKNKLIEV